MKTFRLSWILFVALFFCLTANSQVRLASYGPFKNPNPPAALGNNFAVIDATTFKDEKAGIVSVVAALKAVTAKYEPIQKELQGMKDRITAIDAEVRQKSSSITADQLATLADQSEELKKQYTRKAEDSQANYDRDVEAVVAPLRAAISSSLKEYADSRGILLIFDISTVPLTYAHVSIDITKDFISAYNRNHPVGAATLAKP